MLPSVNVMRCKGRPDMEELLAHCKLQQHSPLGTLCTPRQKYFESLQAETLMGKLLEGRRNQGHHMCAGLGDISAMIAAAIHCSNSLQRGGDLSFAGPVPLTSLHAGCRGRHAVEGRCGPAQSSLCDVEAGVMVLMLRADRGHQRRSPGGGLCDPAQREDGAVPGAGRAVPGRQRHPREPGRRGAHGEAALPTSDLPMHMHHRLGSSIAVLACQGLSLVCLLTGSPELRSAQQAFIGLFQPGDAPGVELCADAALKGWLCQRAASKMCPAEQPMLMLKNMLAILAMDRYPATVILRAVMRKFLQQIDAWCRFTWTGHKRR